MNDGMIDVAIVGAGPYGLSVAAHLRAAGVGFRQFGDPMGLWRNMMPKGMFLKSQGFASNLSDPRGTHTLAAYCADAGLPYRDYGLPVSIATFVGYGDWFREQLLPEIEPGPITRVEQRPGGFELTTAQGETCTAASVVIAAGVEHYANIPTELVGLPDALCTHASAHTDLGRFAQRRVAVVGGGQSALETSALLHESGADVRLVARKQRIVWNGTPLAPDRPLWQRLREPEAGLGSGWGTWFYSNKPEWFRHFTEASRIRRARTALGPAGASWLRERVEDQFPVLVGTAIRSARPTSEGVVLSVDGPGGTQDIAVDHVIAATGYRPDVTRLAFLTDGVRARLRTVAGTPVVGPDYQSSVNGMYFVGPTVAPTFGPVMRFVFGTWHAAAVTGKALSGRRGSRAIAVSSGAR